MTMSKSKLKRIVEWYYIDPVARPGQALTRWDIDEAIKVLQDIIGWLQRSRI
jgi:hypothetical protein